MDKVKKEEEKCLTKNVKILVLW